MFGFLSDGNIRLLYPQNRSAVNAEMGEAFSDNCDFCECRIRKIPFVRRFQYESFSSRVVWIHRKYPASVPDISIFAKKLSRKTCVSERTSVYV